MDASDVWYRVTKERTVRDAAEALTCSIADEHLRDRVLDHFDRLFAEENEAKAQRTAARDSAWKQVVLFVGLAALVAGYTLGKGH